MARSRYYETPDEFDLMVDMYVEHCALADPPKVMTIPGMALFMGFCDKSEITVYEYERDGFAPSAKRAKMIVEEATVRSAMGTSGGGPIFILKNMGYTDRHDVKFDRVVVEIKGADAKL